MRLTIPTGFATLALATVAAIPASAQQSQQKSDFRQPSGAQSLFNFMPKDTARYYGGNVNDGGLAVSSSARQQSGAWPLFESVPKDTARYYGGFVITSARKQ